MTAIRSAPSALRKKKFPSKEENIAVHTRVKKRTKNICFLHIILIYLPKTTGHLCASSPYFLDD
jgi:hypothetical protein